MDRKTSTLMSLGISIALIAAGIWVLCNHHGNLGFGGRAVSNQLMLGGGGMGIIMILFWVAVLSAIGLVVSGMISSHRSSDQTASKNSSDTVSRSEQGDPCDKIGISRSGDLNRSCQKNVPAHEKGGFL